MLGPFQDEQMDFLANVPKWQYEELQGDYKRAEKRMAKLEMEYALLKAKYIETLDWIQKD